LTGPAASLQFTLLSRHGCTLCEEMQVELQAIPQSAAWHLDVRDVDADPALKSRYGHKVPVLLLEGELVCHGRLDREELLKAVSLRS
jgi:hypothetical protein